MAESVGDGVSSTPTLRRDGAPRWLTLGVAPLALGAVGAFGWFVTAYLAITTIPLPLAVKITAQVIALLAVPALVVAPTWFSPPRSPRRMLLTLCIIALGLTPDFILSIPSTYTDPLRVGIFTPFVAPGFSLGVAFGYAWGVRPWGFGAFVGFIGALGYTVMIAALSVALIVYGLPAGPPTTREDWYIRGIYAIILTAIFLAYGLVIVLSIIGGLLGAYLRRR